MKQCKKCNEDKELDQFYNSRRFKDGKELYCKKCGSIQKKNYYNKNKKSLLEYNKNHYNENKETKLEYSKKYYNENPEIRKLYKENNKEKIQKDSRDYFIKNPDYSKINYIKNKDKNLKYNKEYYYNNLDYFSSEERKLYKREWSKENRDIINAWVKNKRLTDIGYKISTVLRSRFHYSIKKRKKTDFIFELIGCSIDEFKLYIESLFLPEMNWGNHGEIWEIDHIFPISKFNFEYEEEQELCFHYSNHQPLFKTTKIAESLGYKDYVGNRNKSNKTNKN